MCVCRVVFGHVPAGSYAFIPDASFVGTVFVHALSNILTTCARSVTLSIEHDVGRVAIAKDEGVLGGYRFETVSWGTLVQVGNVCLGQPKNLVVKVRDWAWWCGRGSE